MGISFIQPLWLLFIPLGILMVVFLNRQVRQLVRWRRNIITSARIMVMVFLTMVLAGVHVRSFSDETTTIFVVDRSDSIIKSEKTVKEFIDKAIERKRPKDKIGIVSFGMQAVVEHSVSDKPVFNGFEAKVESGYSNIQEGLKLAYSLMPTGTRKQIVLITDGEQNIGDAVQQAKILKDGNIALDVFAIEDGDMEDVQISQVSVPEFIHLNESFDVLVKIDSNVSTHAKIQLYADNYRIAEQRVEIQKGENKFVFKDKAVKGGNIVYKAVIDPEIDGVLKNNEYSQFTHVKDTPKVLVVQGADEAARELIKIYKTDSEVTVVRPTAVPLEISELQRYDSIVLSNVSAQELNDKFLEVLESYVKHLGKGLIVTGGEDSYALGGYYKTPLETILPVNMDLKNKADVPNLGLVLVIDKSGSMSEGQYGLSKIELAKEAAIRSTEALKEQDEIGVIAFDGAVQWVVKTGKVDDIRLVQEKIGSIRADGGTSILPALDEAVKSLKGRDTKLKHIILLTDGQAEKYGYDGLVEIMKREGITLSTVAVGTGADLELLQYLAQNGKGRFYKTDEFSDLPKIFTKETFLAGKTYINNRTFTPVLTDISEIMNGITSVPYLHGYIGTSAKSTARVILTSDNQDPILAVWQYGLGRTVAWTPDVKGQWSADWMAWNKAQTFWKNILSWTLQQNYTEEYSLDGNITGNRVNLQLNLNETATDGNVEGIVIGPDSKEREVCFNAVAPGKYKAEFEGDSIGAYLTRINITHPDGRVNAIHSGVVIPYSPEYDINKNNGRDFITRLTKEGGGRLLENVDQVFSRQLDKVWSEADITHVFLILAILVFMMDIAVRRINIPYSKIKVLSNIVENSWIQINKTMTAKAKTFIPQPKAENVEHTEKIEKKKPAAAPQQKEKVIEQPIHTSRLLDMKKNRKV